MLSRRLTQKEAADFLGISLAMLQKIQRKGLLEGTYFRVGRRVIYFEDKLLEWMMAGGTAKQKYGK